MIVQRSVDARRRKEAAMAIRKNESMGFVDAMLAELGGPRSAALLRRLEAATPWKEMAAPILALEEYRHEGPGRPPWDPVLMLKCLMLQKWHGLSDPQLEEHLQDRISFRKFVGLAFDDATPDETTFVVFRDRLREAGLHDAIFEAVNRHLESRGLLVKKGAIVDVTIVEAPRGRTRPDGTSTRDPEASFTKKHGRTHHGYKGHIRADLSRIVTGYRYGTAREHDSTYFDDLTGEERTMVSGDSAFHDRRRRARLRARGVLDAIAYKRVRGQARLYRWQEEHNALVARIRARVEHPFGMLKQQLQHRRTRYRGLQRNTFDFCLTLTACNIKRSLSLTAA
jgi:IS5 family transposase